MDISRYLAEEGKKIDLTQWSTTCDVDIDKKKVKGELLDQTISEMQDLQEKLCADNHYGLIIVLQAMDAAGKDGTVKPRFCPPQSGWRQSAQLQETELGRTGSRLYVAHQ